MPTRLKRSICRRGGAGRRQGDARHGFVLGSHLDHLLQQPIHHGQHGGKVEALNLVRHQSVRALHAREDFTDDLRELDLLAEVGLVVQREVHLHVDESDGPCQPAHQQVELGQRRDARPEVARIMMAPLVKLPVGQDGLCGTEHLGGDFMEQDGVGATSRSWPSAVAILAAGVW